MRSEWQIVYLSDESIELIDGDRGKNYPKKVELLPRGHCVFLNASNITKKGLDFGKTEFITKERDELLRGGKLQKGDTVLTTRGTVGNVGFFSQNTKYRHLRINSGMIILRVADIHEFDEKFLYWVLRSTIVQRQIEALTSGSAQPQLPIRDIKKIRIPRPPVVTQKAIAATLSCLDAKIELNNKINENLEAQAQAIFKSWFVDFEPFGGVRPSDWEVRRLGEYFPVITGKMNANVASDTGSYPFFSCSQSVGLTDQYSFDAKAVLVAGNGGFNVKWYDGKFEAYQRTYVLIPHDGRLLGFLYYATRTGLADITSGARGSVIRFITKGSIENHEITVPINLAELPVVQTLQRMNEQIARRDKESKALAALRDTLLPKLMSGEIEVPID